MDDLHISKRLKALLPPHTKEEFEQLKKNIEEDGEILDPIIYWNDGKKNVVVDGMNRFDIASKGNLAFPSQEIHIEGGYEEVEVWILNHQLGRRNVLNPAAIRKIRGELYNRLKRKDGGHGDQKAHTPQNERSGYQNDTPIKSAAAQVAEIAGVAEVTAKRDGARVKAIEALTKQAKVVAENATDAEVKRLAKLSAEKQNEVAKAIRMKEAKSISEALSGKDKPAATTKPPKKFDRPACFKSWEQAIGPVVRLVAKIGSDVGESRCKSQETISDHLEACTIEMAKWMGVKL